MPLPAGVENTRLLRVWQTPWEDALHNLQVRTARWKEGSEKIHET